MAIFFNDDVEKDDFLSQINASFNHVWSWYMKPEYSNPIVKTDLCLHAIIFPNTFKDIKHYLTNAKMVKWDQHERKFLLADPFHLTSN